MKSLSFAAVVFGTLLLFSPVGAQQPATKGIHQPGQGTVQQMPGMMDQTKMIEQIKAEDARLQMLTDRMKSARGEEKVGAMQDVVSELVANQMTLHQHMMMHLMSQTPDK
jgi:hypothetical protein